MMLIAWVTRMKQQIFFIWHSSTRDRNTGISNLRFSGYRTFYNLEIPIFTMPQYRDFEIVIFTESDDYLIHFALPIASPGMAVVAFVL